MSRAERVVRLGGGGEEALARGGERWTVLHQLRDHAARALALVEDEARRRRERGIERGALGRGARGAKEREQRTEEQPLRRQRGARRARVAAVARVHALRARQSVAK